MTFYPSISKSQRQQIYFKYQGVERVSHDGLCEVDKWVELLSQLCCARTLVPLYSLYDTGIPICLLYVPCTSPTTTVHLLYLPMFPVYPRMYIPNVFLYVLLYSYMPLVHSLTSLYAPYIPLYVLLLSPGCLLCPLHPL